MGLKNPTCIVEPQSPSNTVKQLYPNHVLQLTERSRDCRLRDVESLRRERHTFRMRNFKKGSHMPKLKMGFPIHSIEIMFFTRNINID